MRAIKFRAWDGEQMVSPDYIDRDGIAWWKANSIPTMSKILMQFTGLKDRNGTEIYEGDILRWFCLEDTPYIVDLEPEGMFWYLWSEYANAEYLVEIIGNVHENPELLK